MNKTATIAWFAYRESGALRIARKTTPVDSPHREDLIADITRLWREKNADDNVAAISWIVFIEDEAGPGTLCFADEASKPDLADHKPHTRAGFYAIDKSTGYPMTRYYGADTNSGLTHTAVLKEVVRLWKQCHDSADIVGIEPEIEVLEDHGRTTIDMSGHSIKPGLAVSVPEWA